MRKLMPRLSSRRARAALAATAVTVALVAGATPTAFAGPVTDQTATPSATTAAPVGNLLADPVDVERQMSRAIFVVRGIGAAKVVVPANITGAEGFRVRVQWGGAGQPWSPFSTYEGSVLEFFSRVPTIPGPCGCFVARINIQDPTGKVGTLFNLFFPVP
jgi:hypothetical protein